MTLTETPIWQKALSKKSATVRRHRLRIGFYDVVSETLRGKSLHRTLQNLAGRQLMGEPLSGIVLDMAAGSKPGNYRRFLAQDSPTWVSLDLNADNHPSVQASMDTTLPFLDCAFDSVVFYNGIYISDEPVAVLRELYRVLKPQGRLVLAAPTIFENVPEPHDYWRYTEEGLTKILSEAGFQELYVAQLGGGRWSTAAYVLTPFLWPAPLRVLAYSLAVGLDGLIGRLMSKLGKRLRVIPIGYVVLATKTDEW